MRQSSFASTGHFAIRGRPVGTAFGFVYPVIGGGLGDLANERGHTLARVMA